LCPDGLTVDSLIVSGPDVEAKVGNCLPLKKIPIGLPGEGNMPWIFIDEIQIN
jgi:hypothetical protein